MPEIYTKDNNGNFKSLGNVDTNSLVNTSVLDKCIKKFWTEKKSGKHPQLAKKHKEILLQDLIAKPEDLFEQLNQACYKPNRNILGVDVDVSKLVNARRSIPSAVCRIQPPQVQRLILML